MGSEAQLSEAERNQSNVPVPLANRRQGGKRGRSWLIVYVVSRVESREAGRYPSGYELHIVTAHNQLGFGPERKER